MSEYDSSEDVRAHQKRLQYWAQWFAEGLLTAAAHHDESKLEDPEKSVFDEFIPKLKEYEFGSPEYEDALSRMGLGLVHHYQSNSHHPEHFPNGIAGMNLFDFIEMVLDWMASASVKRAPINLKYLAERFGIPPQLIAMIANTFYEADMDAINNRIDINFMQIENFYDPEERNGD